MEKKFTRQQVEFLREEINKALISVGEKNGLSIAAGNASFTDLNVTFKLEVGFAKTEGYDPNKEVWYANCARVGMRPDDYGKHFTIDGKEYVIIGFDPNARTNSILFEDTKTGKRYCGKPSAICSCLYGTQKPEEHASDAGGSVDQMERILWERRIVLTPLKPDDFGKSIRIGTRTYQIVGFDPQARKNCVLLKYNGTTYKAPIDTVLEGLGRKA